MSSPWVWALALAAGLVLVLALVAWLLTRGQSAETRSLAGRIARLPWRQKASLAWALWRDRRVPFWVRAIIPALVLYLAMPLDIIPDFIPVAGHLDDLAVVLIAGALLLRFTPQAVLEEHLARLEQERLGQQEMSS